MWSLFLQNADIRGFLRDDVPYVVPEWLRKSVFGIPFGQSPGNICIDVLEDCRTHGE
ncbi:hypothetical protein CCP3SC1_70024 [Gammaproteobacteria bacterium]